MSALTILAVIAVLIYIIARQLLGEPIRAKRLIILPGVLTLIGAVDLAKHTVHPTSTDIVLIAIGAAIAAITGAAQGRVMRLEERDGSLWGQLPLQGLWLWALLYASRGGLIVAAHATGAHVAAGAQSELLILGINRLSQAAIVAARALAARIPLAPRKTEASPSRPSQRQSQQPPRHRLTSPPPASQRPGPRRNTPRHRTPQAPDGRTWHARPPRRHQTPRTPAHRTAAQDEQPAAKPAEAGACDDTQQYPDSIPPETTYGHHQAGFRSELTTVDYASSPVSTPGSYLARNA